MVHYVVSKRNRGISGEVTLAPTKSISNRKIVIRVVKKTASDTQGVASKEAYKVFDRSIRRGRASLEKGQTGIAIRLLKAVLSYFGGEWIVTGSKEMGRRPVGDIIRILRRDGFNIKYFERTGFPPIKIIAHGFRGDISRLEASICSQFATTSLSAALSLSTEDFLGLRGKIKNSPYVTQTFKMLNMLGIFSGWKPEEMLIDHEYSDGSELAVEGDWTAASYWYEVVALSKRGSLKIFGLNPDSVQADAIVKEMFEPFGVKTTPIENGVELTKVKATINEFEHNFFNNPNLVPTMIATCVGLQIPFRFTGVESLRDKDFDRLAVLQSQMDVLGANLVVETDGQSETVSFDGVRFKTSKKRHDINSFDDHRVLMSIIPLTLISNEIRINYPNAVHKSYPCFWRDLKSVGFETEEKTD